MYFFYAFGTCVSPRRIFFTPWAPASCAGVFILRVCGNRTCTFTASVFSYPHIVHFFWKVHFWTAPVETKITFLLQVYFGSTCFPKVKRTFNCFKIVRVSTGFGELKSTRSTTSTRFAPFTQPKFTQPKFPQPVQPFSCFFICILALGAQGSRQQTMGHQSICMLCSFSRPKIPCTRCFRGAKTT